MNYFFRIMKKVASYMTEIAMESDVSLSKIMMDCFIFYDFNLFYLIIEREFT